MKPPGSAPSPFETAMTTIKLRLLAGLLVAAGLLSACSGDDPAALLASAKQYIAAKDYKAAQIQLKNALQKQPESAETRFLLGKVFLDVGDPSSAAVELEKARALNHPAAQVVPPLARAMLMQGQRKKLVEQFASTSLRDAAADADLQTTLAIAHASLGDSAQANAALERALQFSPNNEAALLFQARLKAGAGDATGAKALIDRVLVSNPANDDALVLQGHLLLSGAVDRTQALAAYRSALAANSQNLAAHSAAIGILLTQQDPDGAQAQLDALKKVAPSHPQTVYYEAQLALYRRDLVKAGTLGAQLLKAGPDNVRTLQLMGTVELQKGALVQAETHLSRALQLAPQMVAVRQLLAQTYIQQRLGDRAYATIAPLAEQPDAAGHVLSLAAQAQLLRGDNAKAEALFERAVKANPEDMRSRTALALTEIERGQPAQGVDELVQIASKDPGTTADIALISTLVRRRDYDGALKAIEALEKKPAADKALAATLRARVHLVRGDRNAARQHFDRAVAINATYYPAIAALAALDVDAKQPDAAKKRLEALLKIQPQHQQGLLTLATLKARTGSPREEVLTLLNQAVQAHSGALAPRQALIDYYLREKDYKAALTAAQNASAALPDDIALLDALGRVQLAANEHNQALATFNKLANLQPKSPQGPLRIADVHLAMKNNEAALQSLKRALSIQPDLLQAQRGVIALELAAKRPKEAMAAAREVQKQRNDDAVGYALEGDVEAMQRNWSASVAAYRAGLSKKNGEQLAPKVHAALVAGGSRAGAEQWAAEWIKTHPKDARFLSYLGDTALAQRDWAQAENRYQAVLKLQPNNVAALNNVAWSAMQQDKPGALALAEKANSLVPDQPMLMDTLALALAKDKQFDKALELQKKAVAMEPQNNALRLTLAKLLLQSGDKSGARSELDALAKLGDTFRDRAEVDQLLKTF
jgi:putative PEP-CTERM system TPR-repeat lipoprotein